ncbi:hypothetical protein HK098_003857 [Nowakowskiella sp. JEL0407]|nr:hypothetical protein HK098_003857 [Nowakowskiella sp. JEL0407]
MSKTYAKDIPNFNNHIKNVAVVGAGGQIGKFIVEALLANGKHSITALTRKGSSNKIPESVISKEIDYDDQSSLVSALQGQDALVITMAVLAPPDQSQKLIRAAAEAKVPWIVPNDFGFDGKNTQLVKDTFVGIPKKADRDLIESLGVSSWLAIACSFWYEYSLSGGEDRYGFDLTNKTLIQFDDGEEKINTITWPQTGRAVANLLGLKIYPDDVNDQSVTLDGYRNQFINVTSFKVSQKDMLASLLRVTGDSIDDWKIRTVNVEEYYRDGLGKLQQGDRSSFVRVLYSRLFFKGTDGGFVSEIDNEKLGLPVEDLDEYTRIAVEMNKSGFVGN